MKQSKHWLENTKWRPFLLFESFHLSLFTTAVCTIGRRGQLQAAVPVPERRSSGKAATQLIYECSKLRVLPTFLTFWIFYSNSDLFRFQWIIRSPLPDIFASTCTCMLQSSFCIFYPFPTMFGPSFTFTFINDSNWRTILISIIQLL